MTARDQFKIRDLHCFVQTVEHKSLSKAAHILRQHQPRVSSALRRLEEAFNDILFITDQREMKLTPTGQKVYAMARTILENHQDALREIQNDKEGLKGRVTIATPSGFGSLWLIPQLKTFAQQHPDIEVHVILNDHDQKNFQALNKADIGILTFEPSHRAGIHHELLCKYELGFYASKSYLEECGTPTKVSDLDHHRLISWSDVPYGMEKKFNKHLLAGRTPNNPRKSVLRVEVSQLMKAAILNDMGIGGVIASIFCDRDPQLQRIHFEDNVELTSTPHTKYLAYSKSILNSRKYTTVIEWLRQASQREGLSQIEEK